MATLVIGPETRLRAATGRFATADAAGAATAALRFAGGVTVTDAFATRCFAGAAPAGRFFAGAAFADAAFAGAAFAGAAFTARFFGAALAARFPGAALSARFFPAVFASGTRPALRACASLSAANARTCSLMSRIASPTVPIDSFCTLRNRFVGSSFPSFFSGMSETDFTTSSTVLAPLAIASRTTSISVFLLPFMTHPPVDQRCAKHAKRLFPIVRDAQPAQINISARVRSPTSPC